MKYKYTEEELMQVVADNLYVEDNYLCLDGEMPNFSFSVDGELVTKVANITRETSEGCWTKPVISRTFDDGITVIVSGYHEINYDICEWQEGLTFAIFAYIDGVKGSFLAQYTIEGNELVSEQMMDCY